MADWATKLGLSLGGDSEQAYEEGRYTGAKTEAALAEARERVNKNAAQSRAKDDFVKAGFPEHVAQAMATAQTAGGSFKDPLDALLKNQEYGFRAQAGDPNVPLDVGQRALLGVTNAPVEPLYKVGGGYGNKFDSAAGVTPLGPSAGMDGGASAFIQSARAFGLIEPDGSIKPENRALAYEVLRNTDKAFDVGGVPMIRSGNPYGAPGHAVTPAAPGATPVAAPPPAVTPLADVGSVASNKGQIAAAVEQGQAQGRNAAGLQSTVATIDKFDQDIDRFLKQPGFDSLYGNIQGTEAGKAVTGFLDQDVANARADFDTLGGEAFLASIQKMRGFGQLSNQEGLKVQTALTRALDSRIGSPEARAAWAEVKKHMSELKRIAAIEAGQNQNGAPHAAAAAAPAGETKMIGNRKFVKVNGQWMEDDGT